MESDNIKKDLIRKMLSRRVIGSNHMRLVTLMKCGWKPEEKSFVKEVIKDFLKEGILVWYNRSKKALTLNKKRIKEIKSHYSKGE